MKEYDGLYTQPASLTELNAELLTEKSWAAL